MRRIHYPVVATIVKALLLSAAISTVLAQPANSTRQDTPPKPLYPDAAPTCACEELRNVSLPNTTIESAAIDPTDGSCRVTAVVTHPPAKDRVKAEEFVVAGRPRNAFCAVARASRPWTARCAAQL